MRGYVTLPIFIVLTAIGYLYYTTLFVLIDGWLGLSTAAGFANAAVFTALAVVVVVTYGIAVFKDPGRVPNSFSPDIEHSESPIHEIKRKGGDLRYCQKCSHYKPPRAHHCRTCKRCVLRMDHHCVWINNCVGHENYKAFLIFVFYGVIACIHSMVLLVGSASYALHNDQEHNAGFFNISYYHEGVKAMWLAEKVGNVYRHPYDLGIYENLMWVLGPSIFYWFCPVTKNLGSGLRFRTGYDVPLSTFQS
ncbi:probable protein S-acyltransferase 16 isoform X2 [Musa acuminata AAA Group]|uniref:probable protein S-acyltransferase 16 isoform X2 n=1 Tax=Musa acuminata AAA Group TaxID=214697 RepID=UPI0031DDB582